MAAKAFPSLALVAFAIIGPVCGFHRDYPVAIQYLHRMLFGNTEGNDDAFNHTARSSPMHVRAARRSTAGLKHHTGHGAMSALVDGPQHGESVTSAQGAKHKFSAPDLTDVDNDEVSAGVYASTHGPNISRPSSEAETAEVYKAEVSIGDGFHDLNVSGASDWDGAVQENRVKDQTQDPTQNANIPSPSADTETTEEDEANVHIRHQVRELNVSGLNHNTGHGAMSALVDGPQHGESVASAQGAKHKFSAPDLTDVDHDEVSAGVYASTHGPSISRPSSEAETAEEYKAEVSIGDGDHDLNVSGGSDSDGAVQGNGLNDQTQDPTQNANISSPSADAETTEEDEAKVHIFAKVRELNVSGLSNQNGAREDSQVRAQTHDQARNRDPSSLNNGVNRGLADSAKDFMKRALEAAEVQDHEAATSLEKAIATFRKTQDAQDKADAAVKSALDAEVQLIDAKAAGLRNVTAARGLAAAAAKANMDLSNISSQSRRETHTAEEAMRRAKHILDTVRGKLSLAERASAATQRAAAQAAHGTVAAHHELEVEQASAADAAAKKARVEKQVALSSEEIARVSEKFDNANKAKEEALRSFQTAKQELADAVHVGVVMAQKARNGSLLMPASGSIQHHEAGGVK